MASEHYAYILMVDDKYWSRLCQSNKTTLGNQVFIRRNKVAPEHSEQLLFYVSGPKKQQILGTADFIERLTGNFEDLWKRFGSESCFESFDEYKSFADGRETMTFIRFNNFSEVSNPKPKAELVKVLGSLQRFNLRRYVNEQTALQLV